MADWGAVGKGPGISSTGAPVNLINADLGLVGYQTGAQVAGGATNSGTLRTSPIVGTVSVSSIVGTVTAPPSITGTVR